MVFIEAHAKPFFFGFRFFFFAYLYIPEVFELYLVNSFNCWLIASLRVIRPLRVPYRVAIRHKQ
ncbi:Uncharacterised protein [Vibrio cholerae]|nr:Uncharacterised protein [Vibrio cholerae]